MSTIPDRLPNPDDLVNFISGQWTDGECFLSIWHERALCHHQTEPWQMAVVLARIQSFPLAPPLWTGEGLALAYGWLTLRPPLQGSKSDREGKLSYYIPYMWNLKRNTNKLIETDTEGTYACLYTLLYLKRINNKDLLYNTRDWSMLCGSLDGRVV